MRVPTARPEGRVLAGMSLMGAAIVPLEIALVRIFSYTIWHHFAFMVLSIVLLGFAFSGTLLRIHPALATPALERASVFAVLFAASAFGTVVVVAHTPFDPTFVAGHWWEWVPLVVYYLALLVPFTFAGLVVVTLVEAHAASAGTLYGFDLAGAGIGALVAPWALSSIGADGVVLACSALAAAAALALSWRQSPRTSLVAGLALVVTTAAIPFAGPLADIRPGPAKMLGGLLNEAYYPDVRLVSSEWNAIGRVDVIDGAPPTNWTAMGGGAALLPETDIVIDGDALTPILSLEAGPGSLSFLDRMPSTSALQAFAPEHVLVIGAGGGVDVIAARYHGASRIDAVEVNPVIVRLVTGPYADQLDHLFTQPGVTLHNAEGRAFVRQSTERYDLIQISLVDTWAAASSGAYSLAESYLYTTEAFEDYLAHLSDRGALTLTRWLTRPPREALRLCTVASEALRRRGVERPADHIAIVAFGTLATMIVRREPFGPEDVRALERVARARGLQILHVPGAPGDNRLAEYLTSPDPDAFIRAYPYEVAPVADDNPFFFQFGRWSDASPFGHGWRDRITELSGRLVLLTVLLQAVVLSFVLVIIPMLPASHGPRPPGSAAAFGYFFLIGVAFMLIEVVLMQRFTLFLGHPLYALAFVLASLLVSAGAGSVYGRARARASPRGLFLAIALACGAIALGLSSVFHLALAAPLPLRFVVSAVVLMPLGFLLGIPMPIAIERLAAHGQERLVGWAWAGNGVGSVIGPIVAALLAIDLGFTAVLAIAGAVYVLAFLAFGRWWRAPGHSPSASADHSAVASGGSSTP